MRWQLEGHGSTIALPPKEGRRRSWLAPLTRGYVALYDVATDADPAKAEQYSQQAKAKAKAALQKAGSTSAKWVARVALPAWSTALCCAVVLLVGGGLL